MVDGIAAADVPVTEFMFTVTVCVTQAVVLQFPSALT
jgi:hypothetical protein